MSTFPIERRRHTWAPELGPQFCTLCDYLVATDFDPAVIRHELQHRRIEAFVRTFGPLMTCAERAAVERAAYRVLRDGDAVLEARVDAAFAVVRAHHHKYMRGCVKGGLVGAYCSESEFVAAAALERMFAADVAAELRNRYGRYHRPHRPKMAMTDWNYPP